MNRDQFINYQAGTKVPVDVATGLPIDPHDPSNWMSETEARALSPHVGFVLTENDPYFLLDLDKQKDPVTGEWSQIARDMLTVFSGAGQEVSQSGNGLHVIGTCDQALLADRRNKWDGCFEFYTKGRYVALGPHGIQGDTGMDCTSLLLDFVPVRENAGAVVLVDGPAPDWSGPTDDAELIIRMRASRGSAAVQFGDKAPFEALWTADVPTLARFFPAFGDDDFDRSSADAAIMAHLAFWTGRDTARMDRLFRRSGLMREKYEKRKDYREQTVLGAAEGCSAVYSDRKVTTLPTALDGTVMPEPERTAGEYLTIADQMVHFDGYVYIESLHQVLTPDGAVLDAQRFNARCGGKEFQMSSDGTRPTRNAFEAFTQNRAHRFERALGVRNSIDEPFGTIRDGLVNVFQMPQVATSDAPVDMYLDLVAKLLPNERDRRIYLSWCAAMCQSPGHKFQWAITMQGCEGNGKTLLMTFLANAIGESVVHMPDPSRLDEKYNGYLKNNLLVGVEEIHVNGRRSLMDRLKVYITGARVEVREMGVDGYMVDNRTNWYFLSNYKDAVIKTRGDRRHAIYFTPQQRVEDIARDGMNGDYFPRLWDWARAGGWAAVAGYLRRYDVDPEFDPRGACHRAPHTSSTEAAVEESLGSIEQEIQEAVDSGLVGFRGGWISSYRLRRYLDERGFRKISPRVIRGAVENIGYEVCKLWHNGRCGPIFQEDNIRPTLYCTKIINNSAENIDNYLEAQNYSR